MRGIAVAIPAEDREQQSCSLLRSVAVDQATRLAKDGVEPPTPAFSGLYSIIVID